MAKTSDLRIELALEHVCILGESPIWDVKRQEICWVDIVRGEVHYFSPATKIHKSIPLQQMVGSVGVCKNGDYIVAMKDGFAFVSRESGAVRKIVDPEVHLPNNRFNEGKNDPAGRFWAGTLTFAEDSPAGSVYALEADLSFTKKIPDVTISNGMVWSLDQKTFYYIDTPTLGVAAYHYDKATGALSDKRMVIKISSDDGYPDGMTIDNEGMLWIGHWDGWQLTRWNPATGEKIHHIKMPVAKVTSCMFGGPTLEDLYITTAKRDLTEEELKKQPLAGCLFVIRNCGFKGVPVFEFGGA